MKKVTKLFFMAVMFSLTFISCGDDDEEEVTPTVVAPVPTPVNTSNPTDYAVLSTDPSGDANGGLDVIETAYFYDDTLDLIAFRVKTTNLASHSTNPSVDFNFILPNGTDESKPLGQPFSGTIKTHKSIHVYTDDGGTAPSNYNFTDKAGFAVNGVTFSIDSENAENGDDLNNICDDCILMDVDVPNNTITIIVDRKDIVTDTEVGASKSAILTMSSGVGQARRGSDTGSDGARFAIYLK